MNSFKLTTKAKTDLKKIAIFTKKHWGIQQRNIYLLQLDQCFHQLSESPSLGMSCDDIKLGYRKLPQGSHLIFYRINTSNVVEIIRILHKNMDVNSQFN